jgi:hypothetical protein
MAVSARLYRLDDDLLIGGDASNAEAEPQEDY